MSSIYDRLVSELAKGKGLSSSDRNSVISALEKLENSKLNIMLVGATGVGKSLKDKSGKTLLRQMLVEIFCCGVVYIIR